MTVHIFMNVIASALQQKPSKMFHVEDEYELHTRKLKKEYFNV
jgi:hypothetical protein